MRMLSVSSIFMSKTTMKEIILKNRPQGRPQHEDFKIDDTEVSGQIKDNQVLLKLKYLSVDPYMRGRMRDEKSYIEPFKVGEPLESQAVAEVVESKCGKFKTGDHVSGMLQWKEQQICESEVLQKVDGEQVPLSAYLGVLGLTGLTAYFGLDRIGELKEGETLLVSGASGAVGSVVGQIGKIKGCKVIGIAGSDEKVNLMKEKFGFDSGINYETTDDMGEAIQQHCSEGVDVYWDNVGGEILDAAVKNLNDFGRVVNCGAISLYNETGQPTGPRLEPLLVKKSLKMQGFIVRNYRDEFQEGIEQLGNWLQDGKLVHEETIVEGFEKAPDAFIGLFDGENKGKMVVKC